MVLKLVNCGMNVKPENDKHIQGRVNKCIVLGRDGSQCMFRLSFRCSELSQMKFPTC